MRLKTSSSSSSLRFLWLVVAVLVAALLPPPTTAKGPSGGGGGGRSSGGASSARPAAAPPSSPGSSSSGARPAAPPPPYSPGAAPPPYSPSAGGGGGPSGLKGGSIPRTIPGSSIGSGYRSPGVSSSIPRTFGGGYSPVSRAGFLGGGLYRPRPYWIAIIPFYAWAGASVLNPYYGPYCGWNCRYYSRYNDQSGNYYARPYEPIATNATTGAVTLTTVRNTDTAFDNRMQWVISGGGTTIRSIYHDTSDPEIARTQPADFTYGLSLYQMVEYIDTDANGFYSPADAVVRTMSLTTGWTTPLVFAEKTFSGRTYQEGTIGMSSPNATFALTFRASNVLINDTSAGVTVLPNSIGLDLVMTKYNLTAPTNKLALITLLSSAEAFGQDPDLEQVADGNVTKGVQFGDKAGGRFEWLTAPFGGGATSGSRVVFPLPSPLPAAGPEDARVTSGRPETTYVQALNVVPPSSSDPASPVRVSMIAFLDEQILTPDAASSSSAAAPPPFANFSLLGMILVFITSVAAISSW
ncbi:hypothetical protein HDU86_007917 [Geranomyces michiganensis]|nr:hypothetical protein HDU86_007917 [Geranomyces michiganensis]